MSRETTEKAKPGAGSGTTSGGGMPPVPRPDSPAAPPADKEPSPSSTPKAKQPVFGPPKQQASSGASGAPRSADQVPPGPPAKEKAAPTGTSSQGASTPPNGTPAVRPAARTGAPPTIAPSSSGTSTSPSGSGDATVVGTVSAPTGPSRAPRQVTSGARPAAGAIPVAPAAEKKVTGAPRKVRLSISRIDPWSVMKLSFLLSIAIGIMIVVSAVVFWMVLDSQHVFTDVNDMVTGILEGGATEVNILQFVELSRFVSVATIIAIVDVVIFTALGTIGAFLYNIVAALVGGIHLTMTDD